MLQAEKGYRSNKKKRKKREVNFMVTTRKTSSTVEGLRSNFKELLLKNPNHFGNLATGKLKPAVEIVTDTAFEELTCVGFNPATNVLEATIAIKQPTGYGGDLCQQGSTANIRFFVDYGGRPLAPCRPSVTIPDTPPRQAQTESSQKPPASAPSLTPQPPLPP